MIIGFLFALSFAQQCFIQKQTTSYGVNNGTEMDHMRQFTSTVKVTPSHRINGVRMCQDSSLGFLTGLQWQIADI